MCPQYTFFILLGLSLGSFSAYVEGFNCTDSNGKPVDWFSCALKPSVKIPRYYMIISQWNGLALDTDTDHGLNRPGAAVQLWERINTAWAQHWYDDESTGSIRNRWNGYCLEFGDDPNGILVKNTCGYWRSTQRWKRNDNYLVNPYYPNKALTIEGNNKFHRAHLILTPITGKPSQRWSIVFL